MPVASPQHAYDSYACMTRTEFAYTGVRTQTDLCRWHREFPRTQPRDGAIYKTSYIRTHSPHWLVTPVTNNNQIIMYQSICPTQHSLFDVMVSCLCATQSLFSCYAAVWQTSVRLVLRRAFEPRKEEILREMRKFREENLHISKFCRVVIWR